MSNEWLQENCDPDDPETFALWAVMGFEFRGVRVPLGVPMAKALCKTLYKCGFRHHPELQEIKYRRPHRGQKNQYNGAATWVDIDTPDPDPVVVQDFSKATPEERAVAVKQLQDLGAIPDKEVTE